MAAKHPHLTITVARDGTLTTDFLHFTGQACMATGKQLQQALAEFGLSTEITRFEPKPELLAEPSPQVLVQSQELSVHEGGH